MAQALGVDMEQMVLAYQTHTTNVRRVTGEDAGRVLRGSGITVTWTV